MANFFWTPHSGYHWDGSHRRFFEGWYVRLTLPESAATWAFMYSIDDPAGQSALSGGAAQILGPGEQYLCTWLPAVERFWAWPHRLGVGHWGQSTPSCKAVKYLPAETFATVVQCGYQLTATHHQGCLADTDTGAIARWNYTIEPVYGWGSPRGPQWPTAGWLSYLPILEPGWQVLMAHGWASGWAEWGGQRYTFHQAPTYAEKNWGGAFPERWFWIQANAFEPWPDLTLTAVGGRREVLGRSETVGMIGIHFQDQCIFLNSLRDRLAWQVGAWGYWHMTARNHRYRVELEGKAPSAPARVRVPTLTGLQFQCWDTTQGDLTITIWARSPTNPTHESLILQATTSLAALEVGGQGWDRAWTFASSPP
jgi:tocopherol cyclase